MSIEPAYDLSEQVQAAPSRRARYTLLRRLIDIVAMPSSRIPPQDRHMAGDVLLEMLFEADDRDRAFCARRLVPTHEAPRNVLRYLCLCRIDVCRELLEHNSSLDDSDLAYILSRTTTQHAEAVARRKTLSPALCDSIVATKHPEAIRYMLESRRSFISETAMDELLELSAEHNEFCYPLVQRAEMKPYHAMTMFWWASSEERLQILMRFAADRSELIELCGDVFSMAAKENWDDPIVRKTLQLLERRQRNRAAIERSPYESLEDALETAARTGIDRNMAEEIGYLGGLKPVTVAKILTDRGGEPLAVFCKATGLKRHYLSKLWIALKRPTELAPGKLHPTFDAVKEVYEMMSVAKAQTTLRYWNWSLSSNFRLKANSAEDASADNSEFSSSQRAARLVFR